jgi:hypothetical protein
MNTLRLVSVGTAALIVCGCGTVAGRFVFSNGVEGRLDVQAVVAVGGQCHGSVVVK